MGIQHDVRGQRLTVWPCAGTAARLGAADEPLISKADASSAMLNRATYKGVFIDAGQTQWPMDCGRR